MLSSLTFWVTEAFCCRLRDHSFLRMCSELLPSFPLLPPLHFYYLIIWCIWVFCLWIWWICLCTICVPGAWDGQKRELQMVTSHSVCAGKHTHVLWAMSLHVPTCPYTNTSLFCSSPLSPFRLHFCFPFYINFCLNSPLAFIYMNLHNAYDLITSFFLLKCGGFSISFCLWRGVCCIPSGCLK